MDLKELFNLVARSSKASPVFVKPEKKQAFMELAAQQPTAASSLFKWPGQTTNYQLPSTNTTITTGLDSRGEVDRTQSDLYKQYALNAPGQFERYFKTPEMDQYFGTASRGTAAPKDVEAMQALAGRTVAPGKTPEELSAFYRAESAMGRAQMPEIQKGLGYEKGTPLAQWAEANPMLAQRLYAQRQAKEEAAGRPSSMTTYAGVTPEPVAGQDFAIAANAVPAPWNQQGAKVSADFSEVRPFQASKTLMAEGMPSLPTTLDKAEDFLARTKAGSSFADPNMAKAWGSVLH